MKPPHFDCEQHHASLAVRELSAAVDFYTNKLGFSLAYLVFGQRLQQTRPPLKIERVNVPVRLEKRLAALLTDLAAHKRMSLTTCLEEILLHTCDGASPHTKSDLNYIQKLKARHGIDYDSHASYRFVEE